jgi:hypothetical protein
MTAPASPPFDPNDWVDERTVDGGDWFVPDDEDWVVEDAGPPEIPEGFDLVNEPTPRVAPTVVATRPDEDDFLALFVGAIGLAGAATAWRRRKPIGVALRSAWWRTFLVLLPFWATWRFEAIRDEGDYRGADILVAYGWQCLVLPLLCAFAVRWVARGDFSIRR